MADVGGEEAIDEGVGRRVQRGQTLDKGCHGDGGLVLRNAVEHLQQVEDHVGAPAENEDENDDEGHLDGFHFGLGNEAAWRGPSRFWLIVAARGLHSIVGSVASPATIGGRGRRGRRCHGAPLFPDGDDDDNVAGAYEYGRDKEEGDGHNGHV